MPSDSVPIYKLNPLMEGVTVFPVLEMDGVSARLLVPS